MNEKTKEIEGVDFIIAQGDNDAEPRKYVDGEEILKEGKKYEIITQKEYIDNIEGKNEVLFIDKYLVGINLSIYDACNPISPEERHLKETEEHECEKRGCDQNDFSPVGIKKIIFQNCYCYGLIYENLDPLYAKVSFIDSNLKYSNFSNAMLSSIHDDSFPLYSFINSDLSNSTFTNTTLKGVCFKNSNLKHIDLNGAKLFKTIFIGVENFPKLSKEQKKNVIFSEEQRRLYEENKQQKQTIEGIGKEQTKKLLSGFQTLKDDFGKEEKKWFLILLFAFLLFINFNLLFSLFALGVALSELLGLFFGINLSFLGVLLIVFLKNIITFEIRKSILNKTFKIYKIFYIFYIPNLKYSTYFLLINMGGLIFFLFFSSLQIFTGKYDFSFAQNIEISSNNFPLILPLVITLFSFLYFSVHQYSKAKNLRIENQNKIALIHGYQAFQAESDSDKKYEYFLPNFSA